MHWLLIAWIGSLSGSAVTERFATEAECQQVTATLIDFAKIRDTVEFVRWQCVEVTPLE